MSRSWVGIVCALILLASGVAAWLAASTKSATYDENIHLAGSWAALHQGDFRVVRGNNTLWGHWAALPNGPAALTVDHDDPLWRGMLRDFSLQDRWSRKVLYATPGNDPDRLLNRSRAMMTIIGLCLGALIGWWAWRLRGAVAALAAVFAYALDPNILANAPLVKNDITFAFLLLAFSYAVWKLGRKPGWAGVLVVALLYGAAVNVKMSGLVLLPLLVVMLSLAPVRRRRLLLALTPLVAVAAAVAVTWASYGFRFAPTPEGDDRLDTSAVIEKMDTETAIVAGLLWFEEHRLLPQAWTSGTIFQCSDLQARPSFLLGEYSTTGWWYYFPLAMLFKTPLATLIALLLAVVGIIAGRAADGGLRWPRWSTLCLTIPPLCYGLLAMFSGVNIGLRHILPVCPFIFIGLGCGMASLWKLGKTYYRVAALLLAAWLLATTAAGYPHYLSYFNEAVGGARGALGLIGNSNLDWGQDLKLLAAWQRRHPEEKLYLAWPSLADPRYYGIEYTTMNFNWPMQPRGLPGPEPGVLAIGAMLLQGTYVPPLRGQLAELRRQEPIEVLGGTIYLYRLPWW
jgi:4-amino-4-deoxy-L-arabinose transferase-like glycosyltransferase